MVLNLSLSKWNSQITEEEIRSMNHFLRYFGCDFCNANSNEMHYCNETNH